MSARHSIKFFHPLLLAKERGDFGTGMTKVLSVVSVIAVLATIGMVLHLFAATGAEAIADGETNFRFHLQQGIETILDTIWALSIAALAVAGGLTRSVGNRVTWLLASSANRFRPGVRDDRIHRSLRPAVRGWLANRHLGSRRRCASAHKV
jgi:hypothetical protein